MSLTIESTIKLRNGGLLPRLGLGVYQSRGAECENAVRDALNCGYKHVDSAQAYKNEDLVARGLVASGVPRSSVFITSKYMPSHSAPSTDEVYSVARNSLKQLSKAAGGSGGSGSSSANDPEPYIDLMLLHAPWGGETGRANAWAALKRGQDEGWLKDIGVSNYGVKHLEALPAPVPAVNQIELHPWCQQRDIVAYCEQHGIVVEAYCPLVRADPKRLQDPAIVKLTQKYGKEPAQILLRWSLQKGYVALPKSVTPARIKSNADIYDFELDAFDMDALDALDEGARGACSWNPVDQD